MLDKPHITHLNLPQKPKTRP